MCLVVSSLCVIKAEQLAELDWEITNKNSGLSYNTATQLMTMKGVEQKGLLSIAKRGENVLLNFWQEGAYRPTVIYNQETLIDGFAIGDVSRIGSFRFDKKGNFAYIRTAKGPKVKVKLLFNDQVVLTWPRLTKVKILSFKNKAVILSIYDESLRETRFVSYQLAKQSEIESSKQYLGKVQGCDILATKVVKSGIFLQSYCQFDKGTDIQYLDTVSHQISLVSASDADEFFGFKVKGQRNKKSKAQVSFPMLTVSGGASSRQLFHAISGVFLKSLGEPMSLASDEAGKQSWSQSYRTLTLAELYQKTQHPVFARLTAQAMAATLRQQNKNLGIKQEHNPDCGWASRIYSIDAVTPISFMINQAMIANSLINSCIQIGEHCQEPLAQAINNNAQCLVQSYEYLYVKSAALYRIPYGSHFRYDGLYAPWNWHLTWAAVLNHVGNINNKKQLVDRALSIVSQFTNTWQYTDEESSRVLWRYWTPDYYQGWELADNISVHRPKQRPVTGKKLRYEDLNHAGLSLLGLHFLKHSLSPIQQQSLTNTVNDLLTYGSILPRDMDGNGPHNPRWSLGAGWHAFASPDLKARYHTKLPGSVSSNKHLAYALFAQNGAEFELNFTLSLCTSSVVKPANFSCQQQNNWRWNSIDSFLQSNPLFDISVIASIEDNNKQIALRSHYE